jgi:hypothetical protein
MNVLAFDHHARGVDGVDRVTSNLRLYERINQQRQQCIPLWLAIQSKVMTSSTELRRIGLGEQFCNREAALNVELHQGMVLLDERTQQTDRQSAKSIHANTYILRCGRGAFQNRAQCLVLAQMNNN